MTASTAFTPGPWQVHWESDCTGYPTFYLHGFSGEQKRDRVAQDANARLIAAAPDLLDALKDLIEICEADAPEDIPHYIRRARAAIAKAEGK